MFNLTNESDPDRMETRIQELEVEHEALMRQIRDEMEKAGLNFDAMAEEGADLASMPDDVREAVQELNSWLDKRQDDALKQVHNLQQSRETQARLKTEGHWVPCR